MLDKIQSSTNRSFNYNRQSLPINLQLVERYVKLVKNTERLKVLFNQSYQDFCQIHKSIDEQVLIEAFNNDILKGFMDQSTPQ